MGSGTEKKAGEFQYEDGDTWHGSKDGLGIKEISLNAFQKAMREGSKEMTQGGVFSRYIDGEVVQFAIPNQREIFINSVKMVHITVKPHISSLKEKVPADKIIKKMFADVVVQLDAIDKIYLEEKEKLNVHTKNRGGNLDHKTRMKLIDEYNSGLSEIESTREMEIVNSYHLLLSAISFLLNNLGYFEEKGAAW